MSIPIDPYLDIIRTQLETVLMSRDDENRRKVAIYIHRMLTVLLVRSGTRPAALQNALAELAGLLDEMIAELRDIEEGTILIAELISHIRARPDYELAEPLLQTAVRLFIANPNTNRRDLLRKLSAITFNLQKVMRDAVLHQDIKLVAAGNDAAPLDDKQIQALQAYMRRRFAGESSLEVGQIKPIVGGGSKTTLFVDLRHTAHLPESVCLRMDRPVGVHATTVADEYFLIEILHKAGLPVPKPLALQADGSVLGAPFIIVFRIDGHNIGDSLEVTEPTRAYATGLAKALAKLHQVPPQCVGDRLPGAGITTSERMQRNIAKFERSWRISGRPSIALEQAYSWLTEHIEFADGKRAIIHCEPGCHNTLGHNGELAALLDWEMAAIGNPAQDLAYARPLIVQMMPWDEFLAEYKNAGGTIPSDGEMDFYGLWRCIYVIYYIQLASSMFFSGISPQILPAYSSQHLHLLYDFELHNAVRLVYSRY